jgi:Ethylbenzene dehydrogenase
MRLCSARLLITASTSLAAIGCVQSPVSGSAPVDTVVSIGVIAGGGLVPQSSGPVKLKFIGSSARPGEVLAHRFETPPTLDGDASEWADWPATEVALAPPGQAVGLSASAWYCRWRTHHSLVIDPTTGSPICPTPCAPNAMPATAAEGSADCSAPLPPFDHGVATVKVWAAFDDQDLYLLLQWSAPVKHDVHQPWSWDGVAWRSDRSRTEDAAYLSFAIGDSVPSHATRGCATACHVASAPALVIPPTPAPSPWPPSSYLANFSCRTGAAGERLDAWAWRAASTAPYGMADDLRIETTGPAGDRCYAVDGLTCSRACTAKDGAGQSIYPCSRGTSVANVTGSLPGQPFAKATGTGGGDYTLNPPYLFRQLVDPEPGWDPRYLAYPPPPPVGTPPVALASPTGVGSFSLPGFVLQRPSPHRDDVRAGARWANGVWTLELARLRMTKDPDDAQFQSRKSGPMGGGHGSGAYSTISSNIFVPRCATTACHSGGPPPPSGVPVSLDSGVGWSQLVSVPSVQAPLDLIEPGHPEKSYLVNKLRGTQSSVGGLADRMPPPTAGEPLTEEEILSIEAWISSGAPND